MQKEKGTRGAAVLLVGAGGNRVTNGTAAPTVGTWKRGDMVFRTDATSGQNMGWMCTVAGTPGTWVAMPNLA